MYKPKVGDIVTLTVIKEAYGSNYGLKPVVIVVPGMVGVVAATNVPSVYASKRGPDTFNCVDFLHPVTGEVERVAAYNNQLIRFDPYTNPNTTNTPLATPLTNINGLWLKLNDLLSQAYVVTPKVDCHELWVQNDANVFLHSTHKKWFQAVQTLDKILSSF